MSKHDTYETRVRVVTERSSEYLRNAAPHVIASYYTDTMLIRLSNRKVATVTSDAVSLLEF